MLLYENDSASIEDERAKAVMAWCTMSELIQLLNTDLYIRSGHHMDMLVHLLSVIVTFHSKTASERASRRQRVSAAAQQQPASTDLQPAAQTPQSDPSGQLDKPSVSEPDTSKPKDDIPNIPQFDAELLGSVTSVLVREDTNELTVQRASTILRMLSCVAANRGHVLSKLVEVAKVLGTKAMMTLDELSAKLEVTEPSSWSAVGPTVSDLKLLRVLRTLMSITCPGSFPSGNSNGDVPIADDDWEAEPSISIEHITTQLDFAPLWESLSKCLSVLGSNVDAGHEASASPLLSWLVPCVESAFMLNTTRRQPKPDATLSSAEANADAPVREVRQISADHVEYKKVARATHLAMAGQYRDANQLSINRSWALTFQ